MKSQSMTLYFRVNSNNQFKAVIRNIRILCQIKHFFSSEQFRSELNIRAKKICIYKDHVNIKFWRPNSSTHCYSSESQKDLGYAKDA